MENKNSKLNRFLALLLVLLIIPSILLTGCGDKKTISDTNSGTSSLQDQSQTSEGDSNTDSTYEGVTDTSSGSNSDASSGANTSNGGGVKLKAYDAALSATAAQKISITKLQTDMRDNPVGIDFTNPELSWIIESTRRGAKQTYYRVGVSTTEKNAKSGKFDVWDSGIVKSSDTTITYGSKNGTGGTKASTLKARTRYYWTVYAWNENSIENRSTEVGMFETALFGDFGSNNKWITASDTSKNSSATLFRRQFKLSQSVENVSKARLYATAQGCHIMYMNGKRVSDDYFAPGMSNQIKQLYYQTYDVTNMLLKGDNTVAAEVGLGWYNFNGLSDRLQVCLKAKLIVTYKDGTEQVIDTDSNWKATREGATTANAFKKGQTVDARKYISGWNQNNSNSSKWTAVKIPETGSVTLPNTFIAENMEPVRCIKTFRPEKTTDKSTTETKRLYSFSQNMAGTVRIKAKAAAGVTMEVRYGEFLNNDGIITGAEYFGQNGTDRYIFKGDANGETVTFDLVYHGFEYVYIVNGSSDSALKSKKIEILSIEALALSSDIDVTYSLETSNKKINQYVQNTLWSLRSNFISTLTDCPTREKNSWTGDAQIFAAASSYLASTFNHYRNFSKMIKDSQCSDGGICELMPVLSYSLMGNNTKTPSGWSDAVIIIPWEMYNQYGDTQIIKDNYESMKKWISYLMNNKMGKGRNLYFLKDPTDVRSDGWYGDHLNSSSKGSYIEPHGLEGGTVSFVISLAEIGTAFTAYSCLCLSEMAEAIGKTEDAKYYKNLHSRYAAAWRKNFVAADGYTCTSAGTTIKNSNGTYTYTPGDGWFTSYVMGIYFDLFETEELKNKAVKKLVSLLKEADYAQSVGFIGMNFIYPVLSENGEFDTAMKMMEKESYPSLLYMVNQGATTIWESYDGGELSRNHYVFGAPSRWIFSDVLGITHGYENGNEGYTHFNLQPQYASYSNTSVTSAKGSYDARTGTIKAEWSVSSDRKTFNYKCTVPANTTATLALPVENNKATITEGGKAANQATGVKYIKTENGKAYYELQSGSYSFVVKN